MNAAAVGSYFKTLQTNIVAALEGFDGNRFVECNEAAIRTLDVYSARPYRISSGAFARYRPSHQPAGSATFTSSPQ